MKASFFTALCIVASTVTAWAETKVELKKTHLCCGQCVKAVNKVLDGAGVKGTANQDTSTVSFTAADDKAAQKVIDDLAAAGFHGETDSTTVKVKDDSGVTTGKVATLTLKGVHNCCGQCNKTIKETVKKVDGVESEDAAAKSDSFTVKGNFDAKALVKALNDAGFHVTAKKE